MGAVVRSLPRPVLRVVAAPVLAAVVLHLAIVAKYVDRHGGSPGALVCVRAGKAGRPPYEAIPYPFGATGYDGEDYYAIARAPWRTELRLVRQLRILYPALCWLFSGGDARRLLWVMPGVNLAAVGGLAGLGAYLADRRRLSAWWGFLLPLAVGAGLATLRDLTDAVSTLAVCGLLTAVLVRARAGVVTLAAAAALFSREQNLAIVVLLLATSLWNGRWRVATGACGVLALWLGWVAVLWAAHDRAPFLHNGGNFAAPLVGLRSGWAQALGSVGPSRHSLAPLLSLAYLLARLLLAAYVAGRGHEPLVRLVALLGVGLAVVAGTTIYADPWSYERVLVWLPVGIWFHAVQARQRWLFVLLAPGVLSPLLAVRGFI
jgi:hypothetical protein